MLHWERDDPNHLSVQRLGGPPKTPARTLDEQADATAAMMAHFANFTGKLSHGSTRWRPTSSTSPGRPTRSEPCANQVYVMGRFDPNPGEAFVVDVSDGGAEYFTVPLSNIWGTTLDIVDRTGSLNKGAVDAQRRRQLHLRDRPTDPGVANWIDSDGLLEGILTLRMAEFGATGRPRPGRAGTGGRTRRARTSGPGSAPGVGVRTCGRVGFTTAPPICAGCQRGRTDMACWFITGCSTGIGREIASAALEGRHSVAVTARNIGSSPTSPIGSATGRWCCPDVTDHEQITAAVSAAESAFGGIDVLVSNAGCGYLAAVVGATTPRCESCSTPTTSAWWTPQRRCCPACGTVATAMSSTSPR